MAVPPREPFKTASITFRMDQDLHDAIVRAARADKRSVSQWLELLVRDALESAASKRGVTGRGDKRSVKRRALSGSGDKNATKRLTCRGSLPASLFQMVSICAGFLIRPASK